jgi:CheY-like chemotaxis protein
VRDPLRGGSRTARKWNASAKADRIRANSDGGIAGLNVLIVEDDVLTAAHLEATFEEMGASIAGRVPTVRDALEIIELAERLDGAVTDIKLPGETCFPIAEALIKRGTPFVFATAYGETAIPAPFSNIVACEKPVSPVQIARALLASSGMTAPRLTI